ncbi:MAG TPA: hypothetical protein VMZ22_08830 [Acidimicrobiales bacterium]|nr:hypothetical protein [Acidimicrobiales bacterium]
MADDHDPILVQRARALRLANVGQRAGYGLLGIAMFVFGVGLVTGLNDAITTVVVLSMGLAALVLGPAIILGFAAKAAEREERTGSTGH